MNKKLIVRLLGAVLMIEAAALLPSFFVSLYYQDGDSVPILISIFAMLFPGTLIWFLIHPHERGHLRYKEGFVIVASGWIVLSVFGALPFFLSGRYPSYIDAIFESASGFTTTGATVLTNFSDYPRGIMFWRGTTHWIGGMGVLVLTLALLPKMTGRTSHLVRAESPGPSLSKLVPHTGSTAKILYSIYIVLTVTEFIALLLCGLSPYDAALHAMSNAGTGGFSNYSESVAAFANPAAEAVITCFMFLFGVNFALYYKFIKGDRFKAFWHDEEFRWYFNFVGISVILMTLFNLSFYKGNILTSVRYSAFEVCSIFSTTGFVTSNFNLWPVASQALTFLIMFFGACAGSTAGGIKIVRVVLMGKTSLRSVRTTGDPHKIEVIRMDGKSVDEHMLHQIGNFVFLYFSLVVLGAFLLTLEGKYDLLTNLSATLTCLSNVGPGFGGVAADFAGYGYGAKLLCSFLMLAGRLELLPMFILFTGSVWKNIG